MKFFDKVSQVINIVDNTIDLYDGIVKEAKFKQQRRMHELGIDTYKDITISSPEMDED